MAENFRFIEDDVSLPVVSTAGLGIIGIGLTGYVHPLDEHTVIKKAPICDGCEYITDGRLKDLKIERSIYQRLGSHPRICRYISSVRRGIILERFGESLRKWLLELHKQGKTPSRNQVLKWSCQIAEGLAYCHQKDIVQGDVGCHNVLLKDNEVKLCDFGGSSIDGKPHVCAYDPRYQRWDEADENPSIQNELFALGSTMYEICTTMRPYHDESDDTVEQNYKRQCFPDVKSLPVAEIIEKCWHGTYSSADQVVADLKALQTKSMKPHKSSNLNSRPILAALASILTAILLAIWLRPSLT